MMVHDYTLGALDCVLLPDEITLLVKALEALDACGYDENYNQAEEPILRGLRSTLEMAAHACAIVNRTQNSPAEITEVYRRTRAEFGFYTTEENEGKEAV
jgi:hypothetical protein